MKNPRDYGQIATARLRERFARKKTEGRESSAAESAVERGIDYRQYRLSRKEQMRYRIVFCAAAAILSLLFYNNILFAVPLALLSYPCKRYYEAHLAAKRRTELSIQFKDFLASVSSSFSTGRQLTEALAEADENLRLIYAGDAPIVSEVKYMSDRLVRGREQEKETLYDFADRSACEDISDFIDVYFTCLTTGADTIRAIRRAAEQIVDKIDIRNEIRILTAQKKYEAGILSCLPPMILLFLRLSSPDYLAPLYGTAAGFLIMTFALAVQGIAFYWSVRITDIQV
ncbi:MAG: type II secretion system F family protein [Clostridiales Family XIII bacterium]|jgi:tight adherence protein B|nr:type II secretion system F family protein [Clostridiales Family XIII bacterium]